MKDFELLKEGELTLLMQEAGIVSFNDACRFISNIYYGRNSDKTNLSTVYHERRGTCSSKHVFLKRLAEEQEEFDIKLVLGYFKMNAEVIPSLSNLFKEWEIDYLPEAHVYLKYDNQIFDYTRAQSFDFQDYLLDEQPITISEVVQLKDDKHKQYIADWNTTQYSNEQIWEMRESCILH